LKRIAGLLEFSEFYQQILKTESPEKANAVVRHYENMLRNV